MFSVKKGQKNKNLEYKSEKQQKMLVPAPEFLTSLPHSSVCRRLQRCLLTNLDYIIISESGPWVLNTWSLRNKQGTSYCGGVFSDIS